MERKRALPDRSSSELEEAFGADHKTFAGELLKWIENERMRLWHERVKEVNFELFDRAARCAETTYRYRARYAKGVVEVRLGLGANGKVTNLEIVPLSDWNEPLWVGRLVRRGTGRPAEPLGGGGAVESVVAFSGRRQRQRYSETRAVCRPGGPVPGKMPNRPVDCAANEPIPFRRPAFP